MASQVLIQSKAWGQSGDFTNACIISSSDPELIYSITIPEIAHPLLQLLRYSEDVKRQLTNILSVEYYIRAGDRKVQKCPSLRIRAYSF